MELRDGAARAAQPLREGEARPVERHRPALLASRRRRGSREPAGHADPGVRHAHLGEARAGRAAQAAARAAALVVVELHARRAGRVARDRADRRCHAVDRSQVLRGDAGDGRSTPRRGVLALSDREAARSLPHQREPEGAIDQILTDSRWDMKYLGMQILVEGLAMAAFGFMHKLCQEPLLTDLLHYVIRDESRHVAFGVLTLNDWFLQMSP